MSIRSNDMETYELSETENSFITLVNAIAEAEQEMEIYRQVLSDTPEFEPYSSFIHIAKSSNSYITQEDLSHFLKYIILSNYRYNTPTLEQFILKYTEGMSNKIDYKAFCKLILPYSQKIRPIRSKKAEHKMTPIVESRLIKIIKRDIEFILKLDEHKISLRETPQFDLYLLFKAIDKKNEGYITEENLSEYLKEKRQKDLAEYIIRNFDMDIDGTISYKEFEEGILPLYIEDNALSEPLIGELKVNKTLESKEIKYTKQSPSVRNTIAASALGKSYNTPNPFLYRSPTSRQQREGHISSVDKKWMEETKETMGPSRSYRSNMKTAIPGEKRISLDSTSLKELKSTFGKNIAIDELIAALKEQIRIEKNLEDHKINLSLQPDFNLLDAFNIFNPKDKDHIIFLEFTKGLKEIGFSKSEEEIKMMYSYYARNPLKKLTYANFCYMILPANSNCAQVISKRSSTRGMGTSLSKYTQTMLKKLFNQLVEMEKTEEMIRTKLSKSKCFNHYNAFKLIDTHKKGEISLSDVVYY